MSTDIIIQLLQRREVIKHASLKTKLVCSQISVTALMMNKIIEVDKNKTMKSVQVLQHFQQSQALEHIERQLREIVVICVSERVRVKVE